MGEVVDLAKYRKKDVLPPQAVAASMSVEDMRATMYALPSNQARVEYCMMLMAQITMWLIKADHYDNPGDVIRSWVDKKIKLYTNQKKEG